MKIKSINDVITNSSDETYIVKTNLTIWDALEKFKEHLKNEYPDEYPEYIDGNMSDTYIPVVSEHEYGSLMFDWCVMCNLNDAYGDLCRIFGNENVSCY